MPSPQRFDGHAALVTGAARGIGAAIARRLAEEGAHVLVTDVDPAAARTTASGTRQQGLGPRRSPVTWRTAARSRRAWRTPPPPSAGSTSWSTTPTPATPTHRSSRTSRTTSGPAIST
ncbi:SDR family NAD(P)-dependent oxidoreductase [Streptomyces actuosus]|uniref:SDR family NAD(P)-dependent oxidoreductase n=1 Tax=Streptomyces actuosus TaxID=1885 RepID=A0ABS2VHS3_STRAS|nr:SDR family NAD(P)-dependent oxidoreductase [Streptomyces actuosus]